MQSIRACWWAAEKAGENPSRPHGAWPGLRNTTSSAIKLSKRTRSPALTASIQVECTSRIARSSGPICNLRRRTPSSAAAAYLRYTRERAYGAAVCCNGWLRPDAWPRGHEPPGPLVLSPNVSLDRFGQADRHPRPQPQEAHLTTGRVAELHVVRAEDEL